MARNNNNNQLVDKTELVWPDKRTEVERVELPFQTIETINLPRGSKQEGLFETDSDWKNRLIWGDNFLVMGSLLKEFAGKINLIYIDPPFATGDDFSFEVQIGDQEITKKPSALEVMELSPADAQKHDVQFFELAYLEVAAKVKDKKAMVTLKDFIIPNPELLPEEVKSKVKNWSDFIDYWAVDWMFNQHEEWTEEDDTFHNMNQQYRTRKEPKLELSMDYDYKKSGKFNILVKVIDIFGNDTAKLIEVKI